MTKVSAIIPTYNSRQTLARTLDTVSAQTHNPMEIIVVDDGSTDGTPDILREAARTDGRIILIEQQNGGVAAARNTAIAAATGD